MKHKTQQVLVNQNYRIGVLLWLAMICFFVFMTLFVGGVTRLTGSGLSITEWEPIIGAFPPFTHEQWLERFAMYQQIPQFSLLNSGMQLSEFKFIFFWEYLHRNLGRFIGIIFVFPFLYFVFRKALSPSLLKKLIIGFLLGGLQGAMGWYMVKSGLSERVSVSPLRLAAHLSLAFIIFGYFFWLVLKIAFERSFEQNVGEEQKFHPLFSLSVAISAVLGLQVFYGGLVAGHKAGYIFNSFPKMNGLWLPSNIYENSSFLEMLFFNPSSVQFIHRWLGIALILFILGFKVLSRKINLNPMQRLSLNAVVIVGALQVSLGIWTLLSRVEVSIALIHQSTALVLFAACLMLNFSFSARKMPTS